MGYLRSRRAPLLNVPRLQKEKKEYKYKKYKEINIKIAKNPFSKFSMH